MWRPNTAVTARRTASSKSGHCNVGCWHGSLNNRLDQLLQSQPPMQMSDCLRSTQQQPTVPAIRQRPECRKQNVILLLTRQFGKISQCPASSKSGHCNVGCWHGSLNNRLEEFHVSILTFSWQERIYCSACCIF
jgi:hypothetical protein